MGNTTNRKEHSPTAALTLEQLLSEIKQRRLILTFNQHGRVTLWTPKQSVPRSVRLAVRLHSLELYKRITRSDISTCVNPDLHRASWSYQTRRYGCDVCARLLKEVS